MSLLRLGHSSVRSRRRGPILLLGILAGATGQAAGQDGSFVLKGPTDTIAVERFRRAPGRLEGESVLRPANTRQSYVLEYTAQGVPVKMALKFWLLTDSVNAVPRQAVNLDFVGDSVIAAISAGGQQTSQRLGTKAGALPYTNPSTILLELIIARARQLGAAEVPVFLVAGGQTSNVGVKSVGSDSVVVVMGGGEMRLKVDAEGRIQGGEVPAQKVTITLASGQVGSMTAKKPDYAAPAGAPYSAENVTIPTPMGHTLGGTLTLPKGASRAKPVPAIVTITGSGSQDRDEGISIFKGYQPFRELADSLARRGIAVLRMDDRGFGESGGNAAISTSADFAQDIRAGLAYLRTRPEIAADRLGLVGHSEGGIIAPMVAKEEPTLRAIVLLAGTAYTGRQILTFQLGNGIKHDTSLSARKRDSLLAGVPAQIDSMASRQPWLKFFVDYDPVGTARQVKTPVLILNGATDQQVTPDQVPLLEAAFKAAGNQDVTTRVFPAMNHLFVRDPDGFPGGYTSLPSMKVEREVLGTVADWLVKRLGR